MTVDADQQIISMPLDDYLDEAQQRYADGAAGARFEIEQLRLLVNRLDRCAACSTIMAALAIPAAIICAIGWWLK